MMKAAAGRGIDVGRIVEIAEAIAPEASVFDASLGVDEKCLSAEMFVSKRSVRVDFRISPAKAYRQS